jgi:hypothetical protein
MEHERATALISSIDAMLEELELLNLREAPTVPSDLQARAMVLFASLPFEYEVSMRVWSPTELLDILFDVQGHLFDLRNGCSALSSPEARAS